MKDDEYDLIEVDIETWKFGKRLASFSSREEAVEYFFTNVEIPTGSKEVPMIAKKENEEKMNETEMLESKKKESKFYLAVDDVTTFRGKKGNLIRWSKQLNESPFDPNFSVEETEKYWSQQIAPRFDYRFFSDRFTASPETAALYAVYGIENANKLSKEKVKSFFKNLRYDPKCKCYVHMEYITIGNNTPKPYHLKCYENGEYEFVVERHEITVLSTVEEKLNLKSFSK